MKEITFTVLDEDYFLELEKSKKDVEDYVNNLNISSDEKYLLNKKVESYVLTMFAAMKAKESKKIEAIQHLVSTW